MKRPSHSQNGFSALELMIAVTVILAIAAIAIPYFLKARAKANDAAAAAAIRTIDAAQSLYATSYPDAGYAPNLASLGDQGSCDSPTSSHACLIDSALAGGVRGGYLFSLIGDGNIPSFDYTVSASPVSVASGSCVFSSDQSGAIAAQSIALPGSTTMRSSAAMKSGGKNGLQPASNNNGNAGAGAAQNPTFATNQSTDSSNRQGSKSTAAKNAGSTRTMSGSSQGFVQQSGCAVSIQ